MGFFVDKRPKSAIPWCKSVPAATIGLSKRVPLNKSIRNMWIIVAKFDRIIWLLHGHFPLQRLCFFQIVRSLTLNKKKQVLLERTLKPEANHIANQVFYWDLSHVHLYSYGWRFEFSSFHWVFDDFLWRVFSFAATWSNHPKIKR